MSQNEQRTSPVSSLSKTHPRYWMQRLFKRSNTDWQVQIAFHGRRERFPLGTPNKDAAAKIACDIWLCLCEAARREGNVDAAWQQARTRFKPWTIADTVPPAATVGEFLTQVKAAADLKPVTFEIYALKFRRLVSGVIGAESGRTSFDFTRGNQSKRKEMPCVRCGRVVRVRVVKGSTPEAIAKIEPQIVCAPCYQADWRARVDATNLAELTDEKVQKWKIEFLTARAENPLESRRAKSTVSSIIRSSKSLFSSKVLKHVQLAIPDPIPFAGVSAERTSNRYRSRINPALLAQAAKRELSEAYPQHYAVFVLAIAAGLRRDEIDTLSWKQFDWARGTVRVETNVYTAAKSEGSEEDIDIAPELVEFFRDHRRRSGSGFGSEFVVSSDVQPRQGTTYHHYRCNRIFRDLIEWLRKKGVDTHNPLHTLRKEFGSLINQQAGIYAASSALRHSGIKLTRDVYVDRKARIELSYGDLLRKPGAVQRDLFKQDEDAA